MNTDKNLILKAKRLFESSKLTAFVIEDDEHYSPASIAGNERHLIAIAEGE